MEIPFWKIWTYTPFTPVKARLVSLQKETTMKLKFP